MSADPALELRVLSFGDADGGVWGVALDAGAAALVAGDATGASTSVMLESARWQSDGPVWRLSGEGCELEVLPDTEERESFPHEAPYHGITGVQELCHVRGRVRLGDAERTLACAATRCVIDGIDPAAMGSLRAVSGWFGNGEALTLLSMRERGSKGQEADLLAATLFDPDGWVPVQDPRLSTTYDAAGLPARVNLELWVGEGETEYPRRAAGEAVAAGAHLSVPGIDVRAVPLRCHSQGHEGVGLYVLAGL